MSARNHSGHYPDPECSNHLIGAVVAAVDKHIKAFEEAQEFDSDTALVGLHELIKQLPEVLKTQNRVQAVTLEHLEVLVNATEFTANRAAPKGPSFAEFASGSVLGTGARGLERSKIMERIHVGLARALLDIAVHRPELFKGRDRVTLTPYAMHAPEIQRTAEDHHIALGAFFVSSPVTSRVLSGQRACVPA